jgi:hypothetical protein
MAIVLAKHLPYDDGHLAAVIVAMRNLGPPIIRVVRGPFSYIALEGSHRLAACDCLGITPILRLLPADGSADLDRFWQTAMERLPVYKFGEAPIFTQFF